MASDVESQLVRIEKAFWAAAGSDGSYYQATMSDRGKLLLPFEGGQLDKNAAIESVRQSEPWRSYHLSSIGTLSICESGIVLFYHVAADRKDFRYRAYVSSLYVKENEEWKLLVHQQTPLPQVNHDA